MPVYYLWINKPRESPGWQGSQWPCPENRCHAVFHDSTEDSASEHYEFEFPLILVRRGLAQFLTCVADRKKILSDSKSGYICCC